MAQAFNIHGDVRLRGPYNVQPIVQSIRSQFEKVSAKVDFKLPKGASEQIGGLSGDAKKLNAEFLGASRTVGDLARIIRDLKIDPSSKGFDEVRKSARTALRETKLLTDQINGLKSQSELAGEVFGATARRFGAFVVVAKGFQVVTSGFEQAVSKSLAFQNEMVRLSQIGGTTAAAVADVSAEIGRLSAGLGTSSEALSQSSVTLRQAGLSAEETKTALEALAKTTLAPTFESLKSTTEGVIAMRQQFGVASKDIASRLGSINTVSGEFAVESEDLVTALRKAGGAFRSASGDMVSSEQSFNQLLALFTSVRNTTRESADEISTGLRTIFARVQSNSVSNSLKEMGVNLRYTREESQQFGRDVTGQFVGAYEAVRRLSAATRDLPTTDPRYAQIVEQLGGFRQISRVIPLLQQFGTAQKAYSVAQAGANSLTTDAARAQDSFLVKLTKVKEEFFDLIRALTGNKALQGMVDTFLKLTQGALQLAKGLEPLVPLITTIAVAKTLTSVRDFGRGVSTKFNDFAGAAAHISRKERPSPENEVRRRGGGVIPGHGTGDKVPLWAEPGEFVLNRKASQQIGYAALHAWNDGGEPTPRRTRFQSGGSTGFPIVTEPGEFYFDREAVGRIGLTKLAAANRTGRLPQGVVEPRERLAAKIKNIGGMRATLRGFQTGGTIKPEHSPDARAYPHSHPLLQPLDPRERVALKLKAMGRIGDAYKDRTKVAYATGGVVQTPSERVLDWDRIRKLRDLERGKNGETPMKVDGFSRLRRRFEVDPATGKPTPRAKYYATSRSARYALARGYDIPPQVKKLLGRESGGDTDAIKKAILSLRELLGEDFDEIAPRLDGEKFKNAKGGGATKIARTLDRVNDRVQGTGDPAGAALRDIFSQTDPQALENLVRTLKGGVVKGGRMGVDATGKQRSTKRPGLLRDAGLQGPDLAARLKMVEQAARVQHKRIAATAEQEKAAFDEQYPLKPESRPSYQTNEAINRSKIDEVVGTASKSVHTSRDFSASDDSRSLGNTFSEEELADELAEMEADRRLAQSLDVGRVSKFDPSAVKPVGPSDAVDYENYQAKEVRAKSGSLASRFGRTAKVVDAKARPSVETSRLREADSLAAVAAHRTAKAASAAVAPPAPPIAVKAESVGADLANVAPTPKQAPTGVHPNVQKALDEADDKLEDHIFESWGEHVAARVAAVEGETAKTIRDHYFKQARDVKGGGNRETIESYLLSEEADKAGVTKDDLIKQVQAGVKDTPKKGPHYNIPPGEPIGKALALAAVAAQQGIKSTYSPNASAPPQQVKDAFKKEVAAGPSARLATPKTKYVPAVDFSAVDFKREAATPPASGGGRGPRPPRKTASGGGFSEDPNGPAWIRKLVASIDKLDKTITTSEVRKRTASQTAKTSGIPLDERAASAGIPLDGDVPFTIPTLPSVAPVDRTKVRVDLPGPTYDSPFDDVHRASRDEYDLGRRVSHASGSNSDHRDLPFIGPANAPKPINLTNPVAHPPDRGFPIDPRIVATMTTHGAVAFDHAKGTTAPKPTRPHSGRKAIALGTTPEGQYRRELRPDYELADQEAPPRARVEVPLYEHKGVDTGRGILPLAEQVYQRIRKRVEGFEPSGTPIRAGYDERDVADAVRLAVPIVPGQPGPADLGHAPNGRRLVNLGRSPVRTPIGADESRDVRPIPLDASEGEDLGRAPNGRRLTMSDRVRPGRRAVSNQGPIPLDGPIQWPPSAPPSPPVRPRTPIAAPYGLADDSVDQTAKLKQQLENHYRDLLTNRRPGIADHKLRNLSERMAARDVKQGRQGLFDADGGLLGLDSRRPQFRDANAGFVGRSRQAFGAARGGLGAVTRFANADIPIPFRRKPAGVEGVAPPSRRERIGKFANTGAIGVYGATIAASYINDAAGATDPNDVASLERSRGQSKFSGAVTGAAVGAQVGAMAPVPGGVVIGAVVGGLTGLVTSIAAIDKQIKAVKLDKSLQDLSRAIDRVASGRTSPEGGVAAVNSGVEEARKKIAESTQDAGRNWANTVGDFLESWVGDVGGLHNPVLDIGGKAANLGAAASDLPGRLIDWMEGKQAPAGVDASKRSLFGTSAFGLEKAASDARRSKEDETLGPLLPQLRQSMEVLASSIKLDDKDFRTTTGGDARGQRDRREALLGQNGGRQLIETIARIEKLPVAQVVREFDKSLVDANSARSVEVKSTAVANDSDLQARRFERLGSALDLAAASLRKLHDSADALEAIAQGRTATASVSGIAEQAALLGGVDASAVRNTTDFARSSLDGPGGDVIAKFASKIEEIDLVQRELPGLLTGAAKGSDFSEDAIIGDLSKAFEKLTPNTRNQLQTKLDTIDPKTVLQELTANPAKLAGQISEPFNETRSTWQGIVKRLEEAPQKFAADLGRHSLLQDQSGQARDRVADADLGVTQARAGLVSARRGQSRTLTLDELNAPFNARQARLVGGQANPLDSASITRRLQTVQGRALEQGERARDVTLPGAERKQAQVEFTRLTSQAADLQKALANLADSSGRLSAIQTKIAEAEKVQNSQLGLTERLLTGDVSSRVDFNRGVRGAEVAGSQGNFAGFSPENIKLTLEALRAFGDVKFTEGPLKGFTGDEAAKKLLINSSGAFGQNLNAADTQRRIVDGNAQAVNVQEEAAKAATALATVQEGLASKFFDRISTGFDQFFLESSRKLAESDVKDATQAREIVGVNRDKAESRLYAAANVQAEFGGLDSARALAASPDLKDLAQGRTDLDRLAKSRGVLAAADGDLARTGKVLGVQPTSFDGLPRAATPVQPEKIDAFIHGERDRLAKARPLIAARSGLNDVEVEDGLVEYLGKLRQHVTTGRRNGEKFSAGDTLLGSLRTSAANSQQAANDVVHAKTDNIADAVYGDRTAISTGRVAKAADDQFGLGDLLKNLGDVKSLDAAKETFKAQEDKLTAAIEAQNQASEQLKAVLAKIGGAPPTVVQARANGGSIFRPKGTDTVPAMLTPDEFVVKAGQARANRGLLEEINRGSGPVYRAEGGFVAENFRSKRKRQADIRAHINRADELEGPRRAAADSRNYGFIDAYDVSNARRQISNKTALDAHVRDFDASHAAGLQASRSGIKQAVHHQDRIGPSEEALERARKEVARRRRKSDTFVGPPSYVRPSSRVERPSRPRRKYRPNTQAYSVEDNRQVGAQIDAYIGQFLMGFAGGGMVPRGTDSVPAMLSKGEFVVDRSTTSAHLPLLQSLKPEYRASGGAVGRPRPAESGAEGGGSASFAGLEALPGKLTSAFSVLGKSLEPLTALPAAFVDFGRSQKDLGASLAAWSAAAASHGKVVNDAATKLAQAAQAFASVSIPSTIQIQTQHKVEVLINGAQVLAAIKGDMADVVTRQVVSQLEGTVRKIINEMPAR